MREKKTINTEIGKNIQAARDRAGYTQEALSELMGMTPNHLSAIERGASGISLESLQKLCRILGVSSDQLIFGDTAPNDETLHLARRLCSVRKEFRPQIEKAISALLELSAFLTDDNEPHEPMKLD